MKRSRRSGFIGASCIPGDVPVLNEAFAQRLIDTARRIEAKSRLA